MREGAGEHKASARHERKILKEIDILKSTSPTTPNISVLLRSLFVHHPKKDISSQQFPEVISPESGQVSSSPGFSARASAYDV